MEYKLINPSDPYTFITDNLETAAIVVFILGMAYGAEPKDGSEMVPVFLFGGAEDWYKEKFGRPSADGLKAKKKDVADALDSFMLGSFEDRRRYEAALSAITVLDKKAEFINAWQDGRSSMNNIGGKAHALAKTLRNEAMAERAKNCLQQQNMLRSQGVLEYSRRITISKPESDIIQGYLNARSEDEYQGEDSTIINTVYFPDGMSMDIKCCGCQDEPSWTEAVLFDQSGNQVACTEVCDNYTGTWELEYGGIIHRAVVSMEKDDTNLPHAGFLEDAEGICPVCGAEIEYDGRNEVDDEGGLIPWHCPSCGATGSEGYNRTFDRHYNVCSADGKPIPSRETSTYKEKETHD